ncbi:hypothetical protein [Litorimonas haliclonae]|uniref:hypothetical protein n=1 Tax=Litorimonas haliclonae TaxID=2081977 RepID=UPI0039F0FFBC
MRNTKFIFPALFFACVLNACGTTAGSTADKVSEPASVRTGLSPQKLSPGECGLFIWTANDARSFIGFETSNVAKLYLDEKPMAVTREDEGELNALERRYKLPDGQNVPLSLEPGKDLKGGESFSGQLTSKTSEGWDRVTPIVALASCAPRISAK